MDHVQLDDRASAADRRHEAPLPLFHRLDLRQHRRFVRQLEPAGQPMDQPDRGQMRGQRIGEGCGPADERHIADVGMDDVPVQINAVRFLRLPEALRQIGGIGAVAGAENHRIAVDPAAVFQFQAVGRERLDRGPLVPDHAFAQQLVDLFPGQKIEIENVDFDRFVRQRIAGLERILEFDHRFGKPPETGYQPGKRIMQAFFPGFRALVERQEGRRKTGQINAPDVEQVEDVHRDRPMRLPVDQGRFLGEFGDLAGDVERALAEADDGHFFAGHRSRRAIVDRVQDLALEVLPARIIGDIRVEIKPGRDHDKIERLFSLLPGAKVGKFHVPFAVGVLLQSVDAGVEADFVEDAEVPGVIFEIGLQFFSARHPGIAVRHRIIRDFVKRLGRLQAEGMVARRPYPAHFVALFENLACEACPAQQAGGGQARYAGADDADLFDCCNIVHE